MSKTLWKINLKTNEYISSSNSEWYWYTLCWPHKVRLGYNGIIALRLKNLASATIAEGSVHGPVTVRYVLVDNEPILIIEQKENNR